LAIALVIVVVVSACGVLLTVTKNPMAEAPKDVFATAMNEYNNTNYRQSHDLFMKSYYGFKNSSDPSNAWNALQWATKAERVPLEYPYNRSEAQDILRQSFPVCTNSTISAFLDSSNTEKIMCDGEYRYFADLAENFQFRNSTLIKGLSEGMGMNPIYDSLAPIVWGNNSNVGPYFNPGTYEVQGNMTIPRDQLPSNGTLQLWIPTPVSTLSQRNVSVVVTPSQYVVHEPDFDSEMGMVYLEIPLDGMSADVEVSVVYKFTTYQQDFHIDSSNVGVYDRSSAEYQKYTASSGSTLITPDISALAYRIIGNETNPYLEAKPIYDYVVMNYPYSKVPHLSLDTRGLPESVYVFDHGYGDCGAQSMFFSALCRAVGIPARSCGGYQLIPGFSGTHFWAEFMLPNYGWVPADVTVAEAADWTYDQSEQNITEFKDFFFGHLDPYRFIIQVDVGVPLVPDAGQVTVMRLAHQSPVAKCITSDRDMDAIIETDWVFTLPDVRSPA
jgi:transglutaminase-like putative cysteine protease